MGFPACFHSQKQFDEWKDCARLSRESVSICSDCNIEYETKMKTLGNCQKTKWSKIAFKSKEEKTLETALAYIDGSIVKKSKDTKSTGTPKKL